MKSELNRQDILYSYLPPALILQKNVHHFSNRLNFHSTPPHCILLSIPYKMLTVSPLRPPYLRVKRSSSFLFGKDSSILEIIFSIYEGTYDGKRNFFI